jgi:hypothetical protein
MEIPLKPLGKAIALSLPYMNARLGGSLLDKELVKDIMFRFATDSKYLNPNIDL